MILYFDLDSKQLVNAPGFSGIVRSLSFVRGDHETLEVRFLRADAAVTDVTNIVFVIKEIPGPESPALAIANTWENLEGEEYFTATLSLNTEALDTLLGESRSKSLLAEITCHQGGAGPITSQLVAATVTGDLWRGDETTPEELPTPDDEWLAHGHAQTLTAEQRAQARENIGLDPLTSTTAQGPPGPANTLTIGTVTTGAPGSAAAASISGTAPNQVLNLTLPAGETGEEGPPGTTDYNNLSNKPVAGVDFAPAYPRAITVESVWNPSAPTTQLKTIPVGGVPYFGDGGGKPVYSDTASAVCEWVIEEGGPSYWSLKLGNGPNQRIFHSSEDVASPDLVSAWTSQNSWGVSASVSSADITTKTSVKATGAAMLSDLGSAALKDVSAFAPSYPRAIAVTGSLSNTISGTTTFPILTVEPELYEGKPEYKANNGEYGVYWFEGKWRAEYNGVGVGAGAGAWVAEVDTDSPDLVPAGSWVPSDAFSIGIPVVTSADIVTPESIVAGGGATAAQGALADTALQPGDVVAGPLATLATTELAAHQSKTGTNQQLTIFTLGDSMMSGSRLPFGIQWLLHYKTPIIGYALESIITQVVSGTVSEPPANATGRQRQDLFDTGKVWLMSTGAIIRTLNSNGSTVGLYGDKANFYCLKQPGGGTATIEYSRDGGSTWASLGTLDTSGTAGEIARAALAPAAGFGHYLYRITATGGPVHYIGCKVWDSTRSGVIIANGNMGGITINSTLSAPAAVRNTIAADLGSVVLITQFREGPGELTETILNNFLDAWETALPFGEIVLVEQCDTPSLAGNEFTATVNGWYRAAADARTRVSVYDINAAMGSEAERDARGFYNASARGTVTVNTSTNVLTCSAAHSFSVGGEITFSTTGTLPAPLQAWTMENPKRYFVKTAPTSTTFTISETLGGAEVDLTDSGSGTHTVWQTDTIHMSDDAWRFVGADLARQLIGISNGQCPAPIFREASGSREVMFGGFAEEFAPGNYTFRMPRLNRGRFGVVSKTNVGNTYRFGWIIKPASDGTLPDGVSLELWNDAGYKVPLGINGSGYWYYGPGIAPANAETIGARAVWEENANGKSVSGFYHQGAPTVPVLRAGINASGTRTDKFQVWADGKVSQFPPASATPGAVNGELVVEATNNTTLTFKLKGTDGTVRTGTITLA